MRRILLWCYILVNATYILWPGLSLASNQNVIDSLKNKLRVVKSERKRLEILNNLAFEYAQSQPQKARTLAQEALLLAKKFNLLAEISQSYSVIGISYWAQGDYQKALEFLYQALAIREKFGDKARIAPIINNIGAIHHYQSNYKKALQYYLRALHIYEELGLEVSIAHAYNNIGVINKALMNYEKSLFYYLKALEIYKRRDDTQNLAKSYHNIGVTYMKQNRNKLALEYHLKSLKLKEKLGDKMGMANTYICLGSISMKDTPQKALNYLNRALHIMTEAGDKHSTSKCYLHIGQVHKYHNHYSLAAEFLQKSLELAQHIGAQDLEMEAYQEFSALEEGARRNQRALFYYKRYEAVKDQIYNTDKQKLIAEIQTRYETEKKEQEIQLLNKEKELQHVELQSRQTALTKQKDIFFATILVLIIIVTFSVLLFQQYIQKRKVNILLNRQNQEITIQKAAIEEQKEELEKLIATKDKFFTIIAHDLRNPFTALLSITQSLSDDAHDLTHEESKFYIHKVNKSASRIYNLLENLLQWSLAQTGRLQMTREHCDLSHIVDECLLLSMASAEKKDIALQSQIPKETYVQADVNMMRTVLMNLMSNAVKFNNQGGTVTVQGQVYDDLYEVAVVDTGIGISDLDQKKLFRIDVRNKSIGASQGKGTGLGLLLCQEFIELNGGHIWVESKLGQGTTVKFTLVAS
ncbi:tetratricopeptide repeat protein [candidate division CSSED10-310 bacterium]|uniref:histidine kinase n=1 Tax=candidate division CSSED10-310 bacterium TaxID=2855610 RepID=A0ABV6Z170_UNCC1